MNKYFVLSAKEEKFCPKALNEGILHTEFDNRNPFAPLDSDSGDWRKYNYQEAELPGQLWFVTRDKRYDFDYRWDSGGFILFDKLIT